MSKNEQFKNEQATGWQRPHETGAAANDNFDFDPIHPGGATSKRPGRFYTENLTDRETEVVAAAAKEALNPAGGFPTEITDQVSLANSFRPALRAAVPSVASALNGLKTGRFDAVYFTGLPEEEVVAKLCMLAMSFEIGPAYNFETQNEGELIMRLVPKPDAGDNNNAATTEFRMHTDDAVVPRECRVHHICLQGRVNPPGVFTNYSSLVSAMGEMARHDSELTKADVAVLLSPRFQVAFPKSLGAGEGVWTRRRSIFSIGPDGQLELAFPSYNTRPVDPLDVEAIGALDRLYRSLEAVKIPVAIDPGVFFAFSNLRGTHSRDRIGDVHREIWRTYAVNSLGPLQRLTGRIGPIFPIAPFVDLSQEQGGTKCVERNGNKDIQD